MLVLLNLDVGDQFRDCNVLVSGFVPGTHDSDCFDTFLLPIVDDLCLLESGIRIMCADGRERILRVFVLFLPQIGQLQVKLLVLRATTESSSPDVATRRQ